MFKRLLIMTVVLSLMVTPVYAGQFVETDILSQETFSDINEGDWFVEDISFMMRSGIINGYPDGTFRPHAKLTYLDAIVLLIKTAEPDLLQFELETDPSLGGKHWATKHLEIALRLWIIEEKHLEILDKEITRLEFANLIDAAANFGGINQYLEPFSDTNDVAANILYSEGITKGVEVDGKIYYYPNKTLSRAEAATFMRRLKDVHVSSEYVSDYDGI